MYPYPYQQPTQGMFSSVNGVPQLYPAMYPQQGYGNMPSYLNGNIMQAMPMPYMLPTQRRTMETRQSPAGVPARANAITASQTAPVGSSGQGGNAAPGAGMAGQGQGSYLMQPNSSQDFNKASGGQFNASLPTVSNSAFSAPNYSVLTPNQATSGYVLSNGSASRPGLFTI